MAYVRLDTSDPAGNLRWPLAPTTGQRTIVCDARPSQATSRAGCFGFDHGSALEGLAYLDQQRMRSPGRWVGFLSYDLGRTLCDCRLGPAESRLPLYAFTHCAAQRHSAPDAPSHPRVPCNLRSSFTREQYLSAVTRCKQYIAAGDIYQANLSQRFTVGLPDEPSSIYDRLMRRHPAVYGAYLDFGDFALISNSPELFLRITPDRRIITRPIKGTRPRAPGMDVELRDSIKDQAELNMIVDLERNDLGRICEIGSVKVTEPRVIEAHPTIYHGVATIEGVLRPEVTFVDILRATFPGGSITGAPKIRAMQIIDELEPIQRGPYCGAIGYLDSDGTIELNIAIRTMIVRDGLIHIPVGGGIVADSDPAAEYEETLVKARAMFQSLGVSPSQLRS